MDAANENPKNSAPASAQTTGLIYPPPEIQSIADETSRLVAKNGPEFVKRIIANNEGNPKFNFLHDSDPYHAYYEQRLQMALIDRG